MEGDDHNKGLIRDYERTNLSVNDADAIRTARKQRVRIASVSNTPRTSILENHNAPTMVPASRRRRDS